jgi:hypothetical protein
MHLRTMCRKKEGEEHHYWNVVESHRVRNGRVGQRHVLYLGEINDTQKASWLRTIEVLEEKKNKPRQVASFLDNRKLPESMPCDAIQVRLWQIQLSYPRQWVGRRNACFKHAFKGFWTPTTSIEHRGQALVRADHRASFLENGTNMWVMAALASAATTNSGPPFCALTNNPFCLARLFFCELR